MQIRSRAGNSITAPWMAPNTGRVIPWQLSDAVEMWARERGKHATIGWNSATNCAVIDFTLRPDDPRMKAYREGKLRFEPKESLLLNYRETDSQGREYGPFLPLDIEQLGVSGVINMLNEGDVQSGNGKYADMQQAVHAIERRNAQARAKMKDVAVENARLRARDDRRWVAGQPLVTVTTDKGEVDGTGRQV
jgi:hypothetical protein